MNNYLDYETALEILKNTNWLRTDVHGALAFVSEAFDVSVDTILEELDDNK